MPDNAFAVDRLAALYDLAEATRDDLVHYERIVTEFGATSVIDVGCGTGTLACRLAARDIDMVGVDPAIASLNIARRKPSADRVRWIDGDAATAANMVHAASLDMAVMTGNVAQVFLDDDWAQTVSAIHHMLRPGGRFVFETRNPAYRAWEGWTRERSQTTIMSPTDGPVETWVDVLNVDLPFVTFRWTFRFERDGAELESTSTLRFRSRTQIVDSLADAGFSVSEVRDAPDRPGKEFVFICKKPGSER